MQTMTPTKLFAAGSFLLLEDPHPSQTMRALKTIMGSCDKAIAKSAPKSQSAELQKAILDDLKAADQVKHLEWHNLTVIYLPDTDRDGNNICGEVLAVETGDGKQYFPPFADLTGYVVPTERDISAEIEELEDRVQQEEFRS